MKKIFAILLILIFSIFIKGCGFSPIYSKTNIQKNFSIESTEIIGDALISNSIIGNLERFKKNNIEKKIFLKIDANYSKNVLTKDLAGNPTDFELILNTIVEVKSTHKNEEKAYSVVFKEKFNMKKNDDKFEESNYERIIKKDFADSVVSKIIFNLSNN